MTERAEPPDWRASLWTRGNKTWASIWRHSSAKVKNLGDYSATLVRNGKKTWAAMAVGDTRPGSKKRLGRPLATLVCKVKTWATIRRYSSDNELKDLGRYLAALIRNGKKTWAYLATSSATVKRRATYSSVRHRHW
ncbi:hypothetical protein AVEN_22086-1 [Araneus ventricosus]|uniref:Uncharacterized protein n=1 Tax=Araneus ventricosus TaxID=182803 RepID=A0A4Y2F2N6_ARAVE|nr:hypothetical protein AVEN_22086-1 [Araneus ventricosus]